MKKYVIYDRSAFAPQDGAPPCAQRIDRCKAIVSTIGGDLVGVFEDVGVSGSAGARAPGRDRLMKRIKAGGVDYVVMPELARLSRSAATLMTIVAEMKEAGVELLIAHDLMREP